MTVKKKVEKTPLMHQYDIEDIINRGGKVFADSIKEEKKEDVRFTLRIPENLIIKIDQDRGKRIGNVSRNQWILEAISSRLSVDSMV